MIGVGGEKKGKERFKHVGGWGKDTKGSFQD